MTKTCVNVFYLLAYLLIQSCCFVWSLKSCNSGFPTPVSPRFATFCAWIYVYVSIKMLCILSTYIKLEKICSYFPRNCVINPGVNFWLFIQCSENTTLFKIPFMLWMSLLTRFSSFLLLSVLCACPQTDVWAYICVFGSIATQMCKYTNVYIYPGKG